MIYLFIFILTVFDVLLTVYGISKELIEEANPLWMRLFEWNLLIATIIIIAFVGISLLFVNKFKKKCGKWIKPMILSLIFIVVFMIDLYRKIKKYKMNPNLTFYDLWLRDF